MQEYMENWNHISEKKKQGWEIANLGKELEKAFKIGGEFWGLNSGDSNRILNFGNCPQNAAELRRYTPRGHVEMPINERWKVEIPDGYRIFEREFSIAGVQHYKANFFKVVKKAMWSSGCRPRLETGTTQTL